MYMFKHSCITEQPGLACSYHFNYKFQRGFKIVLLVPRELIKDAVHRIIALVRPAT